MPAGQAQKEFHVNEAFALADGLLHCAIEGIASIPPATPVDGTAWLVSGSPSGDWAGQENRLALRQSGNWLFVAPRDGMAVLDRSNGQIRRYANGWKAPSVPAAASGGATVDVQARAAVTALVAALREAGIFPTQ